MKNHSKILSLLFVLIIVSNAVNALEFTSKLRMGSLSAGARPELTNKIGLDGIENIRVSVGTLNLVHTDISMPISADLSIDVIRYYTSPGKLAFDYYDDSYVGGKSVLGLGWDIHMGRILNADYDKNLGFCKHQVQSNPNARFRGPVLELSNGSREELFNSKDTGQGSVEFPLITPTYWVAECTSSGTIVAYSPDGKKYTFGEYAHIKDHEHPVLNVTKVEDKNGNYYTVSYKKVSTWNTDDPDTPQVNINAIDKITAQDGREIIFNYNLQGWLTGLTTPTQTWTYTHEAEGRGGYENDSYLMSVTGPEGYKWQYDYVKSSAYLNWDADALDPLIDKYTGWYAVPGMFGMSQIITPYGAQVDYEYYNRQDITSGDVIQLSAIAKKTITGAGIDQPRIWKYKSDTATRVYDPNTQEYTWVLDDIEITPYITDISNQEKLGSKFYRIEGPDKIEILQFCYHAGDGSTTQAYGWMCNALDGRNVSSRIFNKKLNPDGTENITSVELIEETKYERIFHYDITDEYIWGSTIGHSFPVDVQVSITRGNETYNSLSTNFDKFYNPQLITEFTGTPLTPAQLSSTDPATGEITIPAEPGRIKRQTRYTYLNSEFRGVAAVGDEKWRIGFLESSKLLDFADSQGQDRTPNIFNVYDDYGNIVSAKKHNAETKYTYVQISTDGGLTSHPTGDIETVTDPLNKVTTYSNYKYGIPQNELMPNGDSISRVVDAAGNIESYTNGRGFTTSFAYDLLGRIKSVKTPRLDDNDILLDYAWVNVNFQQTVGAYVEKIKLDGLGNVIEEDKGGIKTTYKYDVLGRTRFVSNPNSIEGVASQYNSLGQLIELKNTADNSKIIYEYPSSIEEEITDENGNKTLLTYRAFSNPDDKELIRTEQKSVNEGSIVTIIERTQRGDVLRVAQGKSIAAYTGDETSLLELKERQYEYDENYFVDKIHHPETGANDVKKNAIGNQIRRQVDLEAPLPEVPSGITTYTYDDLHRLKTVVYPGLETPDLIYGYDGNDNVRKITSGGVILDYTYDINDNLETETLTVDGQAYSTIYTYDGNNALKTIQYPDGLIIDYNPNPLGQATQVSGFVSNITYHPNGQLNTLSYLNGQNITINQDNRLFTQSVVAGNTTNIVNMEYSYDSAGNTKTITDNIDLSNNLILGYDAFDRLRQADGSWGAGIIEYNSRGDITRKAIGATDLTYVYNENGIGTLLFAVKDTLAGTNKYAFNYDEYKNIITNGTDQFIYDEASHLTDVTNRNFKYRYDGNENRASINENGYQRYSLYSQAGSLIYEYDKSKEIKTDYIRVGSYLVARRDDLGICPVLDTDLDTISDCDEYRAGLDPSTSADAALDADGDGLSNVVEYGLGTRIDHKDSDLDGIPDGFEFNNQLNPLDSGDALLDNDGDTLSNLAEYQMGLALYIGIDLNKKDSDGDGLDDNYEIDSGLNPVKKDTDGDQIFDGYEVTHGLLPLDPGDALLDKDGDGASNLDEFKLGSSASDKASVPDGYLKWKYTAVSNITSSPTISENGVVYFATSTGEINALDPDWKTKPLSPNTWQLILPGQEIQFGHTTVIGNDGTIYIAGFNAALNTYYLNAVSPTGVLRWSYPYPVIGEKIIGDPAIGIDGTIYFSTTDGYLTALTTTGAIKWTKRIGFFGVAAPVIGQTGNLYMGACTDYDVGVIYASVVTTVEDLATSGNIISTHKIQNLDINDPDVLLKCDSANVDIVVGEERGDFNDFKVYFYNKATREFRSFYGDGLDLTSSIQYNALSPDTSIVIMSDTDNLYPSEGGEYLITNFYSSPYSYISGFPGNVTLNANTSRRVQVQLLNAAIPMAVAQDNTVYSQTSSGDLHATYTGVFDRSIPSLPEKWIFKLDAPSYSKNKSAPVIAQNGDVYYVVDNALYSIAGNVSPATAWPMAGRDQRHSSNACFNSVVDTDGDLMPDCYETQTGLSRFDPLDADYNNDTDNLSNLQEYLAGSNPNVADTDGDGLNDDLELSFGYSPLYGDSNDNGINDLVEYQSYTSVAQDGDANGDGIVNVVDSMLLQRHVLGYIVLPDTQKARVDLYPPGAPNGILNIQDMLLMSRKVMGL